MRAAEFLAPFDAARRVGGGKPMYIHTYGIGKGAVPKNKLLICLRAFYKLRIGHSGVPDMI